MNIHYTAAPAWFPKFSATQEPHQNDPSDSKKLLSFWPTSASQAPSKSHVIGSVISPPLPLNLASSVLSSADLCTMKVPKRPRLLGHWLCQGDLGYIFAPRGVGKTWLAMSLPVAVSKCAPLGLWEAGELGTKVLYVDGEMPLELSQYRARGLHAMEGDVAFLHHDILFEREGRALNIATKEHQDALTALLLSTGRNCLILDNLSSLASGVDENKGFDYEGIAGWLLELRRRKITVIVIHHAGRNGMMRGHSKREDACSWILELQDAKSDSDKGAKFVSHFAKPSRNTGDPLPDLLWHFTTDSAGTVCIHCEQAQASEYEAFIQLVLDGVDKQADIAVMMNKPGGTISKWTQKALNEGRIRRPGTRLLPPKDSKPSPDDEGGN